MADPKFDAVDTAQKQQIGIPFKKGQSGNPKGRPKGSRAKLGEAFLSDMMADWENHGPSVIEAVRHDKPEQYLKVVASILPKDLNVNVNSLEEVTDDELVKSIRELDAAIRPFLDAQGAGEANEGIAAPTAH